MKRYLDLRVDQTVPPLVENDGTCLCTMTGYLNITHTYCNSLLLFDKCRIRHYISIRKFLYVVFAIQVRDTPADERRESRQNQRRLPGQRWV